ncbi:MULTISPECIES: helix-turn-helix domain-containing protein [Gordonibacter]|uniref:Helix-turn-helix transcriptional regulator n=1 Tax=Gordonibacter faecis TaxID=3047475 RepID=A0ABT7DNT0_9ACTN|nr:helix-turn-helix transcriptional regulator [Gordonibacter sp. KGMB12511]MDJ1650208.1 helix-turn-helix transcriptional regulator [Gordonibacter sp. KGMB12511]
MRIKELRDSKGWTQVECAEYLGFHPSYIARVELGGKNVTLATIDKIAAGFGISLEELFKGL